MTTNKEESKQNNNGRRNFIKTTAVSCLAFSLPEIAFSNFKNTGAAAAATIRIGLITDLHHDVMHDGLQRLQAFTKEAKKHHVDAIFQLGDFAYPGKKNKEIIDHFNNAHPTALHVIGNHDTDSGYTHQQCVDYWGMPAPYYTKEISGISFLFLNGNEKGSPTRKGGYAAYIGEAQISWLKNQLETINTPIVIISHQPLLGPLAVDNAQEVQDILSKFSNKILVAINGHTHIDALLKTKGITYVHINSASYYWVGENYKHQMYSQKIHDQHPWISSTCPYRDSLYSFLTIDPITFTVKIEGKQSEWVGTPPNELGANLLPDLTFGEEIAPRIRNKEVCKLKQ
jgi:Icc protein